MRLPWRQRPSTFTQVSSTCHVRPALPRRLAFNRAVSREARRSSQAGAVSCVNVQAPGVKHLGHDALAERVLQTLEKDQHSNISRRL